MRRWKNVILLSMVLLSVVFTGCFNPPNKNKKKEHGHSHKPPPHGGLVVAWGGEKYHVEFVRDKEKGVGKAYIYDKDIEKMVTIDAKVVKMSFTGADMPKNIELKPNPQKDDPKGKASLFTLEHEVFKSKSKLKGTIHARFDGTGYSSKFDEAKPEHVH